MRVPHWLDRLWLGIIAVAFCIGAPIWFILMAERIGWRWMIGFAIVVIVNRLIARRSNTPVASDPSADHAAP